MHNLETPPEPLRRDIPQDGTISLIGMADISKTTVGKGLAATLGWAHMNTDQLLEAYFGAHLQDIVDTIGLNAFLAAEEQLIANLNAKRCIVSTGDSVIYGLMAIAKLKSLGPIIYLEASIETIRRYITTKRRFRYSAANFGAATYTTLAAGEEYHSYTIYNSAITPDQTFKDLYQKCQSLYTQVADLILATNSLSTTDCIEAIRQWLAPTP